MEKISITPPTWAAAAHVYCAALEGGTAEGRTAARDEIMRLARQYDAACDELREIDAAITEFLAAWDMEQDTREHNQRDRMEAAVAALRGLIGEDK